MPLKFIQIKDKDDASMISPEAGKEIIKEAIASSPWSNYGEVNDDQVNLIVKLYLEHPEPTTRGLFVCMDGPLLVGLLASTIVPGVISNQANELMWYVMPYFQKSGIGAKLIEMYEQWAKDQGCRLLTLSHYDDSIGKAASKLYEAKDYKKIEVTYIKELK